MTPSADEPRARILTRVAFALVMVILIARSLMLETIRDAGTGLANGPAGPGATTILLLDWLSLLPPLLVLGRRLFDRSFTLRGGITHILFAGLAFWAMASTIWADDRFLAFVSSTRLLAAASLFWTMTQLVRRWDHLRMVVGLFIGLLLANVAHGLITRQIDQPDMAIFWTEHKAEFLEQRGWNANDYDARRFEQKLLAGELFGFNASPNTLGALVVMFAILAAAAAAQRLQDRDRPAFFGASVLAGIAGIYLLAHAGSKAAWGALLFGLVLLLAWGFARAAMARQRLLSFAVAITLIALAVVVVITVGLSTGGLPDASLNFRWRYWVGSWRIVLDHPVIGVGWSNFSDHYLATRLPQAAEEIQDPHNFAVRVLVELGSVGFVLCLAWLFTLTWRATRPPLVAPVVTDDDGASHALLPGIGGTLLVAVLISMVAANDLDASNSAFLILDGFKRLIFVTLIAAGVALVLLRGDRTAAFDTRPAPWLAAGLVVALAMLLLQSTIDIALFQIAPLMLFATGAGASLGIGWRDSPPRRESLPLIALSAGAIAWIVLLVAAVIPIGLAEHRAAAGVAALAKNRPDVAARAFGEAFESTYPLNNIDYAMRAANAWISAGPTRSADARRWLDTAVTADPSYTMAWLTRARFNALSGQPDNALADFQRGLSLNPSDAALRLEHADLLERFGRRTEAGAAIAEALRIDDALDPAEPERIEIRSPGERARLMAKMAMLGGQTPQ